LLILILSNRNFFQFHPVIQGFTQEMEDKLSSFCHGIFVYLFRIYLIEKINLKLFELIILPNNQFGVDALWGKRLLLLLLGLIWRLDSTFFARKDIHIIIINTRRNSINICLVIITMRVSDEASGSEKSRITRIISWKKNKYYWLVSYKLKYQIKILDIILIWFVLV